MRVPEEPVCFIYFGKIQFLPHCIWNLPFMSYRLRTKTSITPRGWLNKTPPQPRQHTVYMILSCYFGPTKLLPLTGLGLDPETRVVVIPPLFFNFCWGDGSPLVDLRHLPVLCIRICIGDNAYHHYVVRIWNNLFRIQIQIRLDQWTRGKNKLGLFWRILILGVQFELLRHPEKKMYKYI